MIDPNIFWLAQQRGELSKFIMGCEPYFVQQFNAEDNPQNVTSAFDLVVYKLWRESHDERIPRYLVQGMREALDDEVDVNRAIVTVCNWIVTYYFNLKKKLDGTGFYSDLFELDLHCILDKLRHLIASNEQQLKGDLRWFGDKRYSDSGLWGPKIRQLERLRDLWSGPDLVPAKH